MAQNCDLEKNCADQNTRSGPCMKAAAQSQHEAGQDPKRIQWRPSGMSCIRRVPPSELSRESTLTHISKFPPGGLIRAWAGLQSVYADAEIIGSLRHKLQLRLCLACCTAFEQPAKKS